MNVICTQEISDIILVQREKKKLQLHLFARVGFFSLEEILVVFGTVKQHKKRSNFIIESVGLEKIFKIESNQDSN